MGDLSKHFSRKEFKCQCGCGYDTVDTELIKVLEIIRKHFDRSILITSGCRCCEHNAVIGGNPNSMHLQAKAADIKVQGISPDSVWEFLIETFSGKYGIGRYDSFIHIDVRNEMAGWDRRNKR